MYNACCISYIIYSVPSMTCDLSDRRIAHTCASAHTLSPTLLRNVWSSTSSTSTLGGGARDFPRWTICRACTNCSGFEIGAAGGRTSSSSCAPPASCFFITDLGETGPLSQGVQVGRKAFRICNTNGIEVRKKRPRGSKRGPGGSSEPPEPPYLLLPAPTAGAARSPCGLAGRQR